MPLRVQDASRARARAEADLRPAAERAQIHGSEALTAGAGDRSHLDPGSRARERARIEIEGELGLVGCVRETTLYERRRARNELRTQAAPARPRRGGAGSALRTRPAPPRHRRCGGCGHGSDTAGPCGQTLFEAVAGDTLKPGT